MFVEGMEEYKGIIVEKLKVLERKIELACVGISDDKKLAALFRDLSQLRTDIVRVKHNEVTWEDLKIYNITKAQMEKTSEIRQQREADFKDELADFSSLSEVPLKEYSKNIDPSTNELYSIVEFINNNYLALFTQKAFLYSSRNSGARENIYRHYQELVRLFNSYIEFADTSSTRNSSRMYHDDLLHKEYIAIFKKYYAFISSLRTCIEVIQADETFTESDFNESISNVDPDMRIHGLTLQVALAECKNFIDEVEEYMAFINRDFFDAIQLDNKKN